MPRAQISRSRVPQTAGTGIWLAGPRSLRLHVAGEVLQRGGQSRRVVVGGDAVGEPSAVISTRVPPSTARTAHVIVIVPANARSSERKSTAWTTQSLGTMST